MPRTHDTADFHFEGFENPTTTPVPDVVFDRLLARLGEAELKALLYIIRRTFGFKRERDPISFNQFLRGITKKDGTVLDEGCGVKSRTTLSAALKSLEEKGIIQSEKGTDERGENVTTVYTLRFKGGLDRTSSHHAEASAEPRGVVRNSYHGGTQSAPPVVRNSYPQQTGLQETVLQQHHDADAGSEVVSSLQQFGISRTVAGKLAQAYPHEHLLAKLHLAEWLVTQRSPMVARNPAGWLRRAIEEDYAAPPQYRSPEEQRVEEEKRSRRVQAEQESRRQAEEAYHQSRADAEEKLRTLYPPRRIPGTKLTTETAWQAALGELKGQLTSATFSAWFATTRLVSCDGSAALIATPSSFQAQRLEKRHDGQIKRALQTVLGAPVVCQYVATSELITAANGHHGEDVLPPN